MQTAEMAIVWSFCWKRKKRSRFGKRKRADRHEIEGGEDRKKGFAVSLSRNDALLLILFLDLAAVSPLLRRRWKSYERLFPLELRTSQVDVAADTETLRPLFLQSAPSTVASDGGGAPAASASTRAETALGLRSRPAERASWARRSLSEAETTEEELAFDASSMGMRSFFGAGFFLFLRSSALFFCHQAAKRERERGERRERERVCVPRERGYK